MIAARSKLAMATGIRGVCRSELIAACADVLGRSLGAVSTGARAPCRHRFGGEQYCLTLFDGE